MLWYFILPTRSVVYLIPDHDVTPKSGVSGLNALVPPSYDAMLSLSFTILYLFSSLSRIGLPGGMGRSLPAGDGSSAAAAIVAPGAPHGPG